MKILTLTAIPTGLLRFLLVNIFILCVYVITSNVLQRPLLAGAMRLSENLQVKRSGQWPQVQPQVQKQLPEPTKRAFIQRKSSERVEKTETESKRKSPLSLRFSHQPKPTTDPVQEVLRKADKSNHGNPRTSKSYVLYRAIGNDLTPRHAKGQTWANVNFILQHEENFGDLDVRWYINRIVDPAEELRLINLLLSHNQTFTIERLDLRQFGKVPLQFSVNRIPDYLRSEHNDVRKVPDGRLFSRRRDLFAKKNNFIIANNIVRNDMLRLGIATGATFILPWDGNCFLNRNAWEHLRKDMRSVKEKADTLSQNYFLVPMTRMVESNDPVLDASFHPETAAEEPQIIFHKTAHARFKESLPYGRAPKLELLWRLNGNRTQHFKRNGIKKRIVTTHTRPDDVPPSIAIAKVGWVARLFSGVKNLEMAGAASLRGRSRSEGIERLTMRVAERAAKELFNFSPYSTLMLYDRVALQQNIEAVASGRPSMVLETEVARLRETASKLVDSASGLSASSIEGYSRKAMVLALAGIFTGEDHFLRASDQYLQAGFFNNAERRSVKNTTLLTGARGMNICYLFDTARLLTSVGALEERLLDSLRNWAKTYGHRLETESDGLNAFFADGIEGTLFDTQAACVHAFANESFDLVLKATLLARGRLLQQYAHRAVKDSGKAESSGFRDGIRGAAAWVTLGEVARRVGVDFWSFNRAGTSSKQRPDVASEPPVLRTAIPEVFNVAKAGDGDVAARDGSVEYVAAAFQREYGASVDKGGDFHGDGSEDDGLVPPFWRLAQIV